MAGTRRVVSRARPKLAQTLLAGAAASLVLLGITVVSASVAISRIEESTLNLAATSARSSFMPGDVAEQLARLNANVARAVHTPPEALGPVAERISEIRKDLDESMRNLLDALEPEQRPSWNGIRPEIERLERNLLTAFDFVRGGEPSRAARILDQDVDATIRIHESLNRLDQANEGHLLSVIQSASRRLERIRLLASVAGGLLFLAAVAIWIGVIRTVGRQARLLTDYATRLESANEDLDAFAGRVAHDLKNALHPLVMAAQAVGRSADDPDEVRGLARLIERSSTKTVGIVEGLLAFSRAAVTAETRESASVRKVLDEVLEELAPLITRVGATVETTVEDVHVRCPPTLFHLVLTNLCSNAVKFLEGRPERRVRISAHPEASSCLIGVEDTGPGIPRNCLERIFEPFYRVPGTRAPGTGIGLATVRRIVAAHGGSVSLDSVEGRGSRFEVRLPLGDRNDAA